MLSAALQLRLPEDDRRVQGHHKLSSTRLYGRDDTHQALWVQRQLAHTLSHEWRPQRSMARGGQQPTPGAAFPGGATGPPRHPGPSRPPPDLQRFINAREAQVQPTPNVEEETADHSARVEEDSGKRTPSPPPSTPRTPVRTPRGRRRSRFRKGPDRTMSLFSYGGWSTRPWLGSFEDTPTRTACGYPLDASSITKEVDLSLALCRRTACVFARKAGRA